MDSIGKLAGGIKPRKVYVITDQAGHLDLKGYAIQAIEDCEFAGAAGLVITNTEGNTDLSSKTLLAGHIWYGEIDRVRLGSGSCLVYKL
tara:strand:- start:347 stop:613 length:267 start_codon:yes stop_codon:yes gene_type:complete